MATASKVDRVSTSDGLIEDAGNALTRLGARIVKGLIAAGEMSDNASRARSFARLSALSDDELAERGLSRSDLIVHCFGAKAYL